MNDAFDDDVVRYRKKSKRRPPAKSKHKHEFQPCVFEYEDIMFDRARGFINKPEHSFRMGGYCPVCGKIGITDHEWMRTVPVKPGGSAVRIVNTEDTERELNPATRTLPTFFLEDRWGQKYVDLNSGGKYAK